MSERKTSDVERNKDADRQRKTTGGAPEDFEAHRLHQDADKNLVGRNSDASRNADAADDFEAHSFKVLGDERVLDVERKTTARKHV